MEAWFNEHGVALSLLFGPFLTMCAVLVVVVVGGTIHLGLAYVYYGAKYRWRNRGATSKDPKGLSQFDKLTLQLKEQTKVFKEGTEIYNKLMDESQAATEAHDFDRSKMLLGYVDEVLKLQKVVTAEMHKVQGATDEELPAIGDGIMSKVELLRNFHVVCTNRLEEAA